MLFQFPDAPLKVGKYAPVAGEYDVHIEQRYLVQTVQVIFQGILIVVPTLNIGRDVDEHVIAGDEYFFGWLVQTGMPQGVPRGLNALKTIGPDLNGFALFQQFEFRQ